MAGEIHICTNLPRFPEKWTLDSGECGTAQVLNSYEEFAANLQKADLLLVNGDPALVMKLARLFLLNPKLKKPLVALDLVFRRPETFRMKVAALVKRYLLNQVDHFIHYFRDTSGYARYYGITTERSSFVHFKPNLRYRYEPQRNGEGRYVLCFGRSQRDYDLFFEAMAQLPFPAAIPRPKFEELRTHCSKFTYRLADLPKNVSVLEDDGSQEAMIGMLEEAKLVALPILPASINASGIGVYLNSMLLGRCVIISQTTGAADVLTEEALLVAPNDVGALRDMIRRAWEDDELRRRTAEAGRRHALSLGGEPELRQRVLEQAMAWYRGRSMVVNRT
jgi:glycosyltransferase involved in cell wall biosynthesis